MELKGKVALVTGAGSGIGRAAALALAAEGADMALIGRTPDQLANTAERCREKGVRVHTVLCDVSDEPAMQRGFAEVGDVFGRLDVVVANAGVNGVWAPIDELPYAEWEKTQRINLGGTFLSVHFAIPLMKPTGGSIVVVSSINGTRSFALAGASAYATSKAGQVAFAQMAALELARHKIRVNVVCPGAIVSEIRDNTDQRNTDSVRHPAVYPAGTVPLTGGKPGQAEDVAELILFLGSDRSRHITGTPVWIDGAQSLLV